MRLVFDVLAVAGALALMPTAPVSAQEAPARLTAQSADIDTRIDGKLRPASWALNKALNPDVFGVEVPRDGVREVCFISGPESLCRNVRFGEKHDFVVTFDGFDYPTQIKAVSPAAVFDDAYRAANRGQTQILIPEVYELVNIAIAITPRGMQDTDLVSREKPYYDQVIARFGPHADHPLIAALDAQMQAEMFKYFRLKMNAYAFDFDESGKIVRSPVYDRTGFNGDADNDLLPYLDMLQSFSDQTGFREFYREQAPLYQSQIAYYRDEIDVASSLSWLQANFPDVKPYDSTKIIFSPLVNGSQSLTFFESNGFTELQPHVNFPYPGQGDDELTPQDVALRRGTILFTEMNHGFINPTGEKYAPEIGEAFANRAVWAKAGRSSDAYSSPQSLFGEYMNWALVSLYYHDKADASDRAKMIGDIELIMENRGFPEFAPFSRFVVDLYASRPQGTTLADLYPQIISWAAARQNGPRSDI